MGNEEYKAMMADLYKFLRDKISISFGEYLNDEQKEKLFSFEPENIVIDSEFNKIVKYSPEDGKIHVCDEFLTPEYIQKTKAKNPDFNLEDFNNRVSNEDPRLLLEELIVFSSDLKIQEKDIIKSLFTQEMLKMLLMDREMDPKEEVILCGTIELLAHRLGNQNGFLVSTPKKLLGELEVAISLKRELEDKFEEIVLGGNSLDHLSRLENKGLIDKIDELTDNRKIIESTQNLDNVIDSIANMAKEMHEEVEKKEPVEEIVDIDKTIALEQSAEKVKQEVTEASNKLTETTPLEGELVKNKSRKKMIISALVVVATVLVGILVGWLLFKFK